MADDSIIWDEYEDTAGGESTPSKQPPPVERSALTAGLIVLVLLAGLVGWLSFRVYSAHNAEVKRDLFVRVARQGATNLTTFDYEHVNDDVRRILDGATGSFYDTFSRGSQPFHDLATQAHSKSVGTVIDAGLESQYGDQGQVLVAITVKASDAVTGEQAPQILRMRIMVQKMGDGAKVSNVGFVS